MSKRPAGVAALSRAFRAFRFDRDLLREVTFPAYCGYGDESHSEQAVKAGILAQLLPDLHVQRFRHVHHFVPPEQIYSPAHVDALETLWSRGEQDPGLA